MANQNTDKALLGFAMSSNSLLQKIEAIENQTRDTLFRIENVMVSSFSVTQGIAAGLSENNKVLKEIKEILLRKSEAEKAQFGGSSGMSKLLGLGGFIALTGIGMFGLAMAFQEAGKVKPMDIVSGVAMFAAMLPIAKIMGAILQDPDGGNLFANIKVMKTFALTMGMSMLMMVGMSYALSAMAPVTGDKLITSLAIGAVIYLMGQTFVQLIKAWEFSGIMNFMLNKNNTDDIMRAMFLMTVQTVILAGAMNLMPNVNQQTAINFVIMAAAMIPLSMALVGMRFALAGLQKIDIKTIGKMGLAVATLGIALVPIALAAKMVAGINVSQEEISKLTSMTVALAPLVAVIGLFTAIINITKQSREGTANTTLLKRDNSAKRRAELKPKQIKNFALQSVAIIGVIALLAITLKFAGPMIAQGINAAAAIDPGAAFKMLALMGTMLLIGGLVIGMTVNMIKGKNKKSKGSLIPGMGSESQTMGKITTKDIILAAIILPVIAIGMALTAYALQMMPSTLPKLGMDFLVFSALSGLGLLIFGQALGRTMKLLGNIKLKQIGIAALVIPILAISVLATAWIFQALPDPGSMQAPGPLWSLQAGLAIFLFGGSLLLLSKLAGNFKVGQALKVLLVVALAALSILMVAFAFSLMSDIQYGEAPPLMWSLGVGVALFVLGGVILGLGAIALTVTPAGILLGALTVLVGAAVMYAVAWIFTQIGKIDGLKESAQTITDVLFMPFNAMVDLFQRFKDDIGIENMSGLAAGIGKLALAWLGLGAALAGSAAGGVLSSIGGLASAAFDGLTKLFGGNVEMKPSELLRFLVNNAQTLTVTADTMTKISNSYKLIAARAQGFINGIAPLGRFVERLGSETGIMAAKVFNNFADSYGRYAKANNELDVTKVEATTKMFNALADLAKNNGQNAMKVLADSLLSAVAELSEAVENLDNAVDKQGKATSGVGDAISGAINKMKELVTGKTKEIEANTPGAGSTMDDVVEAIEALEDTLVGSGIRVRQAAY